MPQQATKDLDDLRSEKVSRHDLKIALQVLSHDGMRLLIPALSTVIGIGTCAGLLFWSFGELQNFSPDSIANTRVDLPVEPVAVPKVAPVVASRPHPIRKAVVKPAKVRKTAVKRSHRVASQVYPEYYYWSQDDPTNGRVVRSDEACTEYSWNTKTTSHRNSFRLAN